MSQTWQAILILAVVLVVGAVLGDLVSINAVIPAFFAWIWSLLTAVWEFVGVKGLIIGAVGLIVGWFFLHSPLQRNAKPPTQPKSE
jgi:hypothetical protein